MSFSFSVVIPSHNRPDLLAACLESVRRHAPAATEILVIDDASPGDVVGQVVRRFAGVQVLRLPRRRGFCIAANAGIRLARGEIVELLNDDTEVAAGWAEVVLPIFDDPTVAGVAPLVLKSPYRIDSAGDRYYLGGVAGKRGHGEPLRSYFLKPCRVFGASGSSAFYRRDAVLAVGSFPESFGAYFEDVDLAFRLNRAGWQIRYEPDSRVFHHGGSSYGRSHRRLLERQSHNEERVFWRNVPGPDLRRALPKHLAVLAAKAYRRWQEGNLAPFLSGRLKTLGDLPELIRHRRELIRLGRADNIAQWHVEPRFWGPIG